MAKRFDGHRIAINGKLASLRKDEVVKVLKDEGATIADKLGKDTTLFVFAVAGSTDHKRAEKMAAGGAKLLMVAEDEFRKRYLLPTVDEAYEMLTDKTTGRARLANLLELNRARYMRSVDAYSTIRFEGRSFHKAKLADVSLCGLHFIECDLREADLTSVKWLAGSVKSDFRNATAKDLELVESRDCDFRECNLKEASLRDVEGGRFEGADLETAHILGDFTKCRFDGAKLDGLRGSAKVRDCSFVKSSLQNIKLTRSTFEDCDFTGADLRGATLKGDSGPLLFKNCRLRDADLRNASLSQVRFDHCDLTGAKLEGAVLAQLEVVDSEGFEHTPPAQGPAILALQTAAPTFKNITITVGLRVASKQLECKLYQFDHGTNSSQRQSWLDGENIGSLAIADAITTIAKLKPEAKLDDGSLVVKATKGKAAPALSPKAFEKAVLDAWREALGG